MPPTDSASIAAAETATASLTVVIVWASSTGKVRCPNNGEPSHRGVISNTPPHKDGHGKAERQIELPTRLCPNLCTVALITKNGNCFSRMKSAISAKLGFFSCDPEL